MSEGIVTVTCSQCGATETTDIDDDGGVVAALPAGHVGDACPNVQKAPATK